MAKRTDPPLASRHRTFDDATCLWQSVHALPANGSWGLIVGDCAGFAADFCPCAEKAAHPPKKCSPRKHSEEHARASSL